MADYRNSHCKCSKCFARFAARLPRADPQRWRNTEPTGATKTGDGVYMRCRACDHRWLSYSNAALEAWRIKKLLEANQP